MPDSCQQARFAIGSKPSLDAPRRQDARMHMLLNPGRLRLLTRIFLALLLTLSAMSAAVFWLLQRNPEALAQHYIEQIAGLLAE